MKRKPKPPEGSRGTLRVPRTRAARKSPAPRPPQPLARRIPVTDEGAVSIAVLLECLCAMHLTSYVESPFHDRGGMFLVGAPGALKTTLVQVLDANYSGVLAVSDVNVKGLTDLKQQLTTKNITTLCLPAFEKLYMRNPYTASNAEGTIAALVAEGFTAAAFEDQTIAKLKARAVVIGAMAERFRMLHSHRWDDSGFARRFLWALVSLKDPQMLERAVVDWRLVSFRFQHVPPVPIPPVIQNTTTAEERQQLAHMVKYQPSPHSAQLQALAKMLCVLKWWAVEQGKPAEDGYRKLVEFSRCLGQNGAELTV